MGPSLQTTAKERDATREGFERARRARRQSRGRWPSPQISTGVVSVVAGLTAKAEVGVSRVPLSPGRACGSLNSRTTLLRRPLSSRISRSRRSTSGLRAPAGSTGVGGAQAGGPAAVGTLPAGNCSPAEVVFAAEDADGTDLDTGGFLKDSGLLAGAKAAACGAGAVLGARSRGEPAKERGTDADARLTSLRSQGAGIGERRGAEEGEEGGSRAEGRARPRGVGGAGAGLPVGLAHPAPGAAARGYACGRCGRRWPPRTSTTPARRPRAPGRCTRRPSRSGARRGCTCRRRTAAACRASAGAGASRSAAPRRRGPRHAPPAGWPCSAPAPGTALRRGRHRGGGCLRDPLGDPEGGGGRWRRKRDLSAAARALAPNPFPTRAPHRPGAQDGAGGDSVCPWREGGILSETWAGSPESAGNLEREQGGGTISRPIPAPHSRSSGSPA